MTHLAVSDAWQPLKSHMLIYEQGPQMTVLVDPDHAHIWRQEPYKSDLRRMAADADGRGGYLILFCGEEVVKIEPSLVSAQA